MALDYLEPDFEPNFLTSTQLKKILIENEVDFKPLQSKSELVDLFQRHIGSRAARLKKSSARPVIEVRRTANPQYTRGSTQIKKEEPPSPQTRYRASFQHKDNPTRKGFKDEARPHIFKDSKEQSKLASSSASEDLDNQRRLGPVVYPKIPVLTKHQANLPPPRGFRFRFFPTTTFGQLLFALTFICFIWLRVQLDLLEYCRPNEISKKSQGFESFIPRCIPCPPNAICEDGLFKGCHEGFLARRNPFSTKLLPLSPSCSVDIGHLKRVEVLTASAVSILQYQLGHYQCLSQSVSKGLTVPELYQRLFDSAEPKIPKTEFGKIFKEVIDNLSRRKETVEFMVTEEAEGESAVIYAIQPSLSLFCKAKMSTHLYYRELLMSLAVILALEFLRRWIQTHYHETKLVKRCVAKVLDMLAERDHLHLTQPKLYPENSISIMHARDQLLSKTYPSLSARDRVWSRVISHIDTNTNVRTFQRNHRGDVHRVWEWVGDVCPNPRPFDKSLHVPTFGSDSPINSVDDEGNDSN
ncbi:inner nuclear membrane protein enriched at telomere/subtelomere region [Entomophthora muscae]|uniref:Inner nuclear membrane protein enriched at telomere/subtelomere region n=1 Tax=Entomophthora muscae TaxID=34485 RepID=A0ACC2RUW9_9FUNG|nr:inner nuclear membrane protein enriched at telomere/subtelomere region [Entomophthora muscae]